MSQTKQYPAGSSDVSTAVWDLFQGLVQWRLWAFLGLHDIRQRYRRSTFGPLWLALGLGATILGIGILYSQILKTTTTSFIPYLAIGLLLWNLISMVVIESTSMFQSGSTLISSVRVPFTSFVLRCLVRNLIVAAHSVIPVALAFAFCRYPVHPTVVLALPGLVLVVANLYWISFCIGVACLRFRDLGQIVLYATQLALFVTPIIWMPNQVRPASPFLLFNPIYHLINVVRMPIYNGTFPVQSALIDLGMLVPGCAISLFLLIRFRRHLVFWL